MQVIEAYNLALKQQLEKHRFESGEIGAAELTTWQPGQVIRNWIRVESGNLVGKTKLAAGLFSHFFDVFPSIIYTFAPSWEQINDLLWKEIRKDRRANDRPGRVLDTPRLNAGPDHFALGKATNNAHDSGIERIQGQHEPYLMFILDEAEGVADFVYDALEGMDAGLVVIVLLLANPRTRTSRFHKLAGQEYVQSFRISTLSHPNVVQGRQVVPGAATRDWVKRRLAQYTEVVDEHDEDEHTFEVPWLPGKIFRPLPEFFWRILGIAPPDVADDTFCPVGRYRAATQRPPSGDDPPHRARLGADVARYGNDKGTLYVRHAGRVWRAAAFSHQDTYKYYLRIKSEMRDLLARGVTDIQVRVDAGGGFGGGVVDHLNADLEIRRREGDFAQLYRFEVLEVNFNALPYDPKAFYDLVTEMYYHAGEALKILRLENPPDNLEAELCERTYSYGKKEGRDVKVLVSKEKFRTQIRRSPDDGDGLVLAAAPDYLFTGRRKKAQVW